MTCHEREKKEEFVTTTNGTYMFSSLTRILRHGLPCYNSDHKDFSSFFACRNLITGNVDRKHKLVNSVSAGSWNRDNVAE